MGEPRGYGLLNILAFEVGVSLEHLFPENFGLNNGHSGAVSAPA
jgi:hypothetical protein